jgi:hypothetical protein
MLPVWRNSLTGLVDVRVQRRRPDGPAEGLCRATLVYDVVMPYLQAQKNAPKGAFFT